MAVDIGIDLGTASVLVYVKGKGVILKEPSVVAFDRDSNEVKAIGEEARLMLGRTPGNIVAIRPLRQGVISDYTVTEKLISYFVQKALGKRTFKKPRISICVPSGVTEVERKAVEEATYAAGAREVKLIEEPVAAAIGAGIDISRPCGNMIVDIGGGTSDIAVISLGGTVVNTSIKLAGDDFDEAIVRYMRKKHNLLIGERTAEDIKIKIGTTYPLIENEVMEVRGRNLVTGLPKTVTVTSSETEEALRETRGSNKCSGADPSGAFSRYFGQGNCTHRRRSYVKRPGGDDRGKNRYQHNDCRGADAGCSNRNRSVCRTDERPERYLKLMEKIKGYVEHIVYRNDDNGYTVFNLNNDDGDLTCVGKFHYIEEGSLMELTGEYTVHKLYGTQLQVETSRICEPEDLVSIERYLGSGAVKGVGASLAGKIVKKFKEDTFRIIEEEPERLAEIKGISERKAREIAVQVEEKREMRKVMIFLQKYGISTTLAAKIYERYGQSVYRVIEENPYQMADHVPGVGFRTADEIAAKVGIHTDSDYRIRSGIFYTLLQSVGEGHIYLSQEALLYRALRLLEVEIAHIEGYLMDLSMEKKIILKKTENGYMCQDTIIWS